MAKLTKEELISKISNIEDQDLAISLMEDITDSFEVAEDEAEKEALKNKIEELSFELTDLKTKYKERFMTGAVAESDNDVVPEMEEKEIVDIKEI